MTMQATTRNLNLTHLLGGVRSSCASRSQSLRSSLRTRSAATQRSATASFSSMVTTAQSAGSKVNTAASRSSLGIANQTAKAGILQGAVSAKSAETTKSASIPQGFINTPLGVFDPGSASLAATQDGNGKLTRSYFLTAYPAEYVGDTDKVARFTELFGIKATKILQGFGAVAGHIVASFQPSADQTSVYNDQGNRAWYSVMDILDTMPENRAALGVDLSAYTPASLLDLYRVNPNFRFYTAGSTPDGASPANLGRA